MKLYIIVRAALSAGLKAAQACHAMRAFVGEHPEIDQQWFAESNNIVVLQMEDLDDLTEELDQAGFRLSRFHEPDLDDQLTALCVEPAAWKRLSNIPLAHA